MSRLVAVVVLASCIGATGGDAIESGPNYHPTRDRILVAPVLALATPVRGSTDDAVPNIAASCTGGGTAGTWSGRVYRFVAPRSATYAFAVRAEFPAVVEVAMTREGPQENRGLVCGGKAVHVTLRGGEIYSVTIDGEMQATGAYELVATVDESATARIRAEDAAVTGALVDRAAPLALGRTFGTYASVAAGPRPACGGLGSGTVYTLDVATAGTLALHAVTQFPAAIELRDRRGASLGCARGDFEVALALRVEPGAYVVVIDTTALSPALFDPLHGYPIAVATPGAGVRGAFTLDTVVTP